MSWEALFERATTFEVEESEIRETLDRLRGEDDGRGTSEGPAGVDGHGHDHWRGEDGDAP